MASSLVVILVIFASTSSWAKTPILSDEFIQSINQKQTTWVAGRNFPEDTPLEYLRRLCGERDPAPNNKIPLKIHQVILEAIPDTFDARTNWPNCESTNTIRNQGGCGSCWAFGAVSAMSDRLCIVTDGAVKFEFSPEELISCCTECGHGCQGGSSTRAWDYWVSDGIVLGGDCYTGKGCQPYSESAFENGVTPECDKTCSNADYETRYSEDKHYGASHYKIESDVSQIQAEIMANGPVEGSFTVYDDFFAYQTGVYQYTYGDVAGAHAIKILGWGVENDTPYWLVANSWGENWGGLGGFFKILRGEDHCGIENNINAGEPKL